MVVEAIMRKLLCRAKPGIVFAGHGVAVNFRNRTTEEVHIPFEDFSEIIDLLTRLDFDFLSMSEVLNLSLKNFNHHKQWAHLTFDDGYQNNFDIVYPFLAKRNIPFSVFVSTYYVQTGERFPTFWLRLAEELDLPLAASFPNQSLGGSPARDLFESMLHFGTFEQHVATVEKVKSLFSPKQLSRSDEYYNDKPMSLAALKAMACDPRVHIGSHSHHHIILHQGQNPTVVSDNLNESIRLLREQWEVSANPTFCYPNGDWARQWVALTRSLGIKLAFSSATGFVDSWVEPLLMPRFWLSNARRTRLICAMSLLGNKSLYLFGRKPPPKRASITQ
jgi:peptidoglycan/xylan/chitin deacetylase (PgdA/CDA1 family)